MLNIAPPSALRSRPPSSHSDGGAVTTSPRRRGAIWIFLGRSGKPQVVRIQAARNDTPSTPTPGHAVEPESTRTLLAVFNIDVPRSSKRARHGAPPDAEQARAPNPGAGSVQPFADADAGTPGPARQPFDLTTGFLLAAREAYHRGGFGDDASSIFSLAVIASALVSRMDQRQPIFSRRVGDPCAAAAPASPARSLFPTIGTGILSNCKVSDAS